MRTNWIVAAAAVVFVGVAGLAIPSADNGRGNGQGNGQGNGHEGHGESRVQAGLAFVRDQGIQLNAKGRNRDLVGLGSYLVNAVGGCNDCHTAPSYSADPFAFLGAPKQVNLACYLAGGQVFGPFVSRDITPWEDGKPAGLTEQEFEHVMRTGEDPDNPGHVLQVMPWPTYQAMTDRDLRAVYEYLSSIPAIPANTCGAPSE
jgi:hypothetical protein